MFCKKLTAAAVALSLLAGVSPVLPVQSPMTASAESITGSLTDTITYTIDGDTLTLSGTGATGNFNASAGYPDYRLNEDIRHVIVEEGITELGYWTLHLPNLESVTLPDSIETLNNYFIYDDYKARTLLIGSEGSAAQTYAQENSMFFQDAKTGGIADITGSFTDSIRYSLHYADRTLTVTGTGEIPDYDSSNRSPVGNLYFWRVVIGEGITRIGDRAFAINNPSSWYQTGNYYVDADVQQVILPDSLRSVGEAPFGNLPDDLLTVEDGCRYFGSILLDTAERENATAPLTIREGTQFIAEEAFRYTYDGVPDSVTLPQSIRGIDSLPRCLVRGTSGSAAQTYAGSHCLLFEDVNTGAVTEPSGVCGAGVTYRLAADGTLTISGDGPMTDYVYVSGDGEYIWGYPLDGSLNWLDAPASNPFACNGCIRHIVVEPGVRTLGDFAFKDLPNLETLIIPDTVTRIGGSCIMGCPKLSSLDIPESVTVIAEWGSMPMSYSPFSGCDALTDITFPHHLTEIGNVQDCPYFENMDVLYAGNFLLGANTLPEDGVLHIESGTTHVKEWGFYQNASGNTALKKIIFPDGMRVIQHAAFGGNEGLAEAELPDTVEYIGDWGFWNTALTEVTVPASTYYVGKRAFGNCPELTSITFLNPYTEIYPDKDTIAGNWDSDPANVVYTGVIRGYEGSTAQSFAEKWGYTFESLGEIPAHTQGDLNADGSLGTLDVLVLQKYLVRQSVLTAAQTALADLDGNGRINAVDLALLKQRVTQ